MSGTAPDTVDALLARMVGHDTVNSAASGRPRAEQTLVEYLDGVARGWGLETRRLAVALSPAKCDEVGDVPEPAEQLLVIVEATQDHAPWLLFDSHLDTVAVDNMTIDPFAAEVRDGRLYGRGACDTKGTGAAALWALREYARQTDRPNHVALLFSVDEEFNMTGVDSFIANDLPALKDRFGGGPAAVIVGEPTMLRPVIAHNGVVRWRIGVQGVAAHSAAPYLGKNAISTMARVIRAVEDDYIATRTAEHPITGKPVCSITVIQGGSQVNIVPEHCRIDIDRRLVPGETPGSELAALDAVLEPIRTLDEDVKITVEQRRYAPALDEACNAAVLPRVQAVLDELGLPKAPIGAPFATHGGDLCAAGLPALVWGPGEPYPAHTKDEWVELAAIHKGVEAYLLFMSATRDVGAIVSQ